MQNNSLVSIAMATYNGDKYLREQLDSIYSQTYKNLEVIVTDDCSTDDTTNILREYEQKHGLKYYANDHTLGFVKNFERAISLCNANFIALSDQDDVWLPTKIEVMYNEITNLEYDNPNKPIIVHHDAFVVNEKLINYSHKFIKKRGNIYGLNYLLFGNAKVQGASIIFNRKLKQMCFPLPDNIPFHDLYMSYVCECFGIRKFISEPLMLYRQHDNNQIGVISNSLSEKLLRYFNKQPVLADENEILTLTLFKNKFYTELNRICKNIIIDYFEILTNEIGLRFKIKKIIKNRFNSDGSTFKLILKIIKYKS